MQILSSIQGLIILGLGLLALGMEIYALAHAVPQRQDAFVAAGKKTKTFWVAALVIATLLGIAGFGGFGLLSIIGIVVAGVYLADVRLAIDQVMGRHR